MSLVKQRITDKIELVGNPAYRTIQVRYDNQILEDGVVINNGQFERITLTPGLLVEDTYTRTNLADYDTEVRNIAEMFWIEASYTAHEAYLRSQV